VENEVEVDLKTSASRKLGNPVSVPGAGRKAIVPSEASDQIQLSHHVTLDDSPRVTRSRSRRFSFNTAKVSPTASYTATPIDDMSYHGL
jgi:hypothetical protein